LQLGEKQNGNKEEELEEAKQGNCPTYRGRATATGTGGTTGSTTGSNCPVYWRS